MATPARPPLATAAAITLFVVGALWILFGLIILGAASAFGGGGTGVLYLILFAGDGAFSIFAGVQVMALKDQGRTMGLAAAGIGVLLGIWALIQGAPIYFLLLAADAFVVYALINTQAAFRRA